MSAAIAFGKGFRGAFGKGMKDSPFRPEIQFEDGTSVEEAAERGGLDFTIAQTPSLFMHKGTLHASGQKTLFREDNGMFISSMSEGYKVVQPMEILETHRSFLDVGGYHLRAAGTFKGGARFWSMAEGHGELELAGGDKVKSYLFMASAADGSSATYALGTNMRMHCWNQAPSIIAEAKQNGKFIRVTHSQVFDAEDARVRIMSNDENFKLWAEDARMLSNERMSIAAALEYFGDVIGIEEEEEDKHTRLDAIADNKRAKLMMDLFAGQGMGSTLASAKGTVWGAYNAVTEYVDHHANNQTGESRLMSATMGQGLRLKLVAWERAMQLAGRTA